MTDPIQRYGLFGTVGINTPFAFAMCESNDGLYVLAADAAAHEAQAVGAARAEQDMTTFGEGWDAGAMTVYTGGVPGDGQDGFLPANGSRHYQRGYEKGVADAKADVR